MFIQVLLVLLLSILRRVQCYSACDEVDISILVDTDSIKADTNNKIIDLVTSIVERGCSELSAFSVWIYGENIPNYMNPHVLSLDDTVNITRRSQLVEDIENQLIADFARIRATSLRSGGRIITLSDAFNAASHQQKPYRTHKRTQQTGIDGLGRHDDEDEYLIFNINSGDINNFIQTEKRTICRLLKHEKNRDETIHFLLYDSVYDYFSEDEDEVPYIVCDSGSFIPKIKRDTFINFAELIEYDGSFNKERLEYIYRITCPANVDASGSFGKGNRMELGNHDQFIDAATIIACSINDNDQHQDSYMLVKDIVDDDNTFEVDGYLLITEDELISLMVYHPECCDLPPLHIKRIVDDDDLNDDPSYVQRKLYVERPRSATEYIIEAKLDGDVPGPNRNTLCPSDPDIDGEDDPNPQVLQYLSELLAGIATDDNFSALQDNQTNDTQALARRLFDADFSIIGGPKRWGAEFNTEFTLGLLTASANYGFELGFDVRLNIHFDWNLWPWGYIDLSFKIYGYFEASAWFHLQIKFQWVQTFKLLEWSHAFAPRVHGVAIIIRPFFVLQARFETLPFIISAGIDCGYRREWAIGYWVNTTRWFGNFRHGKIESSKTTRNGCERYFEIGDEGNQMATMCDSYELGLDLYIEPIVGAALYEIVAAWIRLELKIPFRVLIPETDTSICAYDMYNCDSIPLVAGFKLLPFELSLYFGVDLDISIWKIIDVIQSLATGEMFTEIDIDDYTGWRIGGPWIITNTIRLGCMPLDWLFPDAWIEYIEARCCIEPTTSTLLPSTSLSANASDIAAISPIREIFENNKNVLIGGIIIFMVISVIIIYIECIGCVRNHKSMKYKTVDVESSDIDSSDIEYGSEIPLNNE